jgi:hypothetical protein
MFVTFKLLSVKWVQANVAGSVPPTPRLGTVLRAGASRERAPGGFGTLPALLGAPRSLGHSQSLGAHSQGVP